MSWADSKEAGQKARPKAGQGCGKLVSVDWLTKSSSGLPVSSRSPRSKGNPPSLYNRSHICLPIFNYGFSKGAGPMLKTKEKKFWMCSRLFLENAEKKERQLTSTQPWNDSLYEDQYSVPLPPIQVTRNKATSNGNRTEWSPIFGL